jgi:hypothetical protein
MLAYASFFRKEREREVLVFVNDGLGQAVVDSSHLFPRASCLMGTIRAEASIVAWRGSRILDPFDAKQGRAPAPLASWLYLLAGRALNDSEPKSSPPLIRFVALSPCTKQTQQPRHIPRTATINHTPRYRHLILRSCQQRKCGRKACTAAGPRRCPTRTTMVR